MATEKKHQGIVKFFNESKGYGFITEQGSGKDYFVHASNLGGEMIAKDNTVTFDLEEGSKGLKAVNVVII